MLFIAEECVEDALVMLELFGMIERASGAASATLDVLSNALPMYLNVDAVRQLYYWTFSPYVEMIMGWMF